AAALWRRRDGPGRRGGNAGFPQRRRQLCETRRGSVDLLGVEEFPVQYAAAVVRVYEHDGYRERAAVAHAMPAGGAAGARRRDAQVIEPEVGVDAQLTEHADAGEILVTAHRRADIGEAPLADDGDVGWQQPRQRRAVIGRRGAAISLLPPWP